MANELELKAVVDDPARIRAALAAAGARRTFRGLLRDRRLDAGGRLSAADTVLRVRRWIPADGPEAALVGWKGPASVSVEGYKQREELEYEVEDGAAALQVFAALGYEVVHAIDRAVEVHALADGVARLEWYPRMDVLLEIEGTPAAIEALVAATGLSREACLPDALPLFTRRYEVRTGRPAVLAEADLGGEAPGWSGW